MHWVAVWSHYAGAGDTACFVRVGTLDNPRVRGSLASDNLRVQSGVSGTDLRNPHFAAFARSFGALGEIVEETAQFGPAFERIVDLFALPTPGGQVAASLRVVAAGAAPEGEEPDHSLAPRAHHRATTSSSARSMSAATRSA